MIGIRRVIVNVAAAVLALAVGIALGSGTLNGDVDERLGADVDRLGQEKSELRHQVGELRQADRYRDAFASDLAPILIQNRLGDRQVVLIALPGADATVVKNVRGTVAAAGATVTGSVRMTRKWGDPRQRQFLEDLAAQLVTGDLPLPEDGTAYDRAGAVLARAVVTNEDGAAGRADDQTPTIMGAFGEGDLAQAEGDLARADLAVVVAPPGSTASAEQSDGPNAAWVALARALDSASRGAVVVGDMSSAAGDGVLAALRSDAEVGAEVSSVDVADLPSGRVALVWALAEQVAGQSGHYGAVGDTDGALPRGPLGGGAGQ